MYGLAAGLTYEEIAERLNLSASSIATHRRKLGLALHVSDGNIVLVLRAAVRLGHLPPDVLAHSTTNLIEKMQ